MQNQKMIKVDNYKNPIILCFLLIAVFILFLFIYTTEAKSTKSVEDKTDYKELIQKYFPGYVLMDIEELDPYAKDRFRSYHPDLNPSLVCGDFDGNGFLDYAFLLRNSKDKKGTTIFTIFMQSKHSQFELEFCLNMGFYRNDVIIQRIEAGKILSQTKSIDEPKEDVKLKNAAVELAYFEKSSVVYYWDDKTKKFEEIWTSD